MPAIPSALVRLIERQPGSDPKHDERNESDEHFEDAARRIGMAIALQDLDPIARLLRLRQRLGTGRG